MGFSYADFSFAFNFWYLIFFFLLSGVPFLFCVRLRAFILYKAHTHIYAHARVGIDLF
nr:MAG TPA: hypothetical protein [Caudoviricetes sp.]